MFVIEKLLKTKRTVVDCNSRDTFISWPSKVFEIGNKRIYVETTVVPCGQNVLV